MAKIEAKIIIGVPDDSGDARDLVITVVPDGVKLGIGFNEHTLSKEDLQSLIRTLRSLGVFDDV